jgi:hypothetical protein
MGDDVDTVTSRVIEVPGSGATRTGTANWVRKPVSIGTLGTFSEVLATSPCCVAITTPTSCRKVGPAASTPTSYRNGYRPAGSTKPNDPKPTHASNASTPNANNSLGAGGHPTPHESVP